MGVTDLDRQAARIALQEWWFFGSQYVDGDRTDLPVRQADDGHEVRGREDAGGFKQRVWTYFKHGVYPDSDRWKPVRGLAWSAAFVSFCMRNAGAGRRFPYSVGHHDYVTAAMRNRIAGSLDDRMVAYDRAEIAPRVGDLVWFGARNETVDATNWTFADLKNHIQQNGPFVSSHCDLVVQVDLAGRAILVIGGNVIDTVLRMKIPIGADGKLVSRRYPVILRNNIGEMAVA